ncbi:hypothetical protein [Pseudomaricurvus sp.]|uniref:hypothetical protein n=1 Tax=Pseudomaricurvus sp. TaxID=2004510 RepID=UPI003F6C9B6A
MTNLAIMNASEKQSQRIDAPGMASGSSVDETLLSYLLASIERAEYYEEPFCHLCFTDFFPVDVYQKMMSLQPRGQFYKDLNHKEALLANGSSTRQVLPFNPQRLDELDEEEQHFWSVIQKTMADERLRQALFHKLSVGIGQRLKIDKSEAKTVPAWPKGGLFIDKSGYRISPHRDVFTKLVTTQFYLPADDSQKELGTSLYRRDWKGRLNREFNKLGLAQRQEFTHEKTFPFMPNTGYAFVVGPKSWHGREPLPEGSRERRSLMHIYYLKPDVKFYDN